MNRAIKNFKLESVQGSTCIFCWCRCFGHPVCKALTRGRCDCSIREQGVPSLVIIRVILNHAVCTLPKSHPAEVAVIFRGLNDILNLVVAATLEYWRGHPVGIC